MRTPQTHQAVVGDTHRGIRALRPGSQTQVREWPGKQGTARENETLSRNRGVLLSDPNAQVHQKASTFPGVNTSQAPSLPGTYLPSPTLVGRACHHLSLAPNSVHFL